MLDRDAPPVEVDRDVRVDHVRDLPEQPARVQDVLPEVDEPHADVKVVVLVEEHLVVDDERRVLPRVGSPELERRAVLGDTRHLGEEPGRVLDVLEKVRGVHVRDAPVRETGAGRSARSTTWSTPGPGWMSSPMVPSFFLPPQPRSIRSPAIARHYHPGRILIGVLSSSGAIPRARRRVDDLVVGLEEARAIHERIVLPRIVTRRCRILKGVTKVGGRARSCATCSDAPGTRPPRPPATAGSSRRVRWQDDAGLRDRRSALAETDAIRSSGFV